MSSIKPPSDGLMFMEVLTAEDEIKMFKRQRDALVIERNLYRDALHTLVVYNERLDKLQPWALPDAFKRAREILDSYNPDRLGDNVFRGGTADQTGQPK